MSIHKLTAGSGYTYLTRQVAALDATERGHTSLASYYTDKGETPGVWVGAGLAGIDGLAAGDVVTEEQMKALFGAGLHPLADELAARLEGPGLTAADYRLVTRLGAPYRVYPGDVTAFQLEVAKRVAALNQTPDGGRRRGVGGGSGPGPHAGRRASCSWPSMAGTRMRGSWPGWLRGSRSRGRRRSPGTT